MDFFGTERIKLESIKSGLQGKIVPSRSTFYPNRSIFFFAHVNGPVEIRPLVQILRLKSSILLLSGPVFGRLVFCSLVALCKRELINIPANRIYS